MAVEQGIFLDNSRPRNAHKHQLPAAAAAAYDTTLNGRDGLFRITPDFLQDGQVPFVGVRGGDGSLSFVTDAVVKTDPAVRPAIIATGGGTVNTGLTELVIEPAVPIPDHLAEFFPPAAYEARSYRPPLLTYLDSGRQRAAMYLFGADHLSVNGTRAQEWLARRSANHELTYQLAGVATLGLLARPTLTPELISYVANGERFTPESESSRLACLAMALPRLGTFQFHDRVPQDKVWLLTIAGNPVMTRLRYLAMALVGVGLPEGPDRAVAHGFVERLVVDSAVIQPDMDRAARDIPNTNTDGELAVVGEPVEVSRYPEAVLYVLPKPLVAELQARH